MTLPAGALAQLELIEMQHDGFTATYTVTVRKDRSDLDSEWKACYVYFRMKGAQFSTTTIPARKRGLLYIIRGIDVTRFIIEVICDPPYPTHHMIWSHMKV